LGLFSLEKRRLWGDLTAAFQHVKGAYKKDGDKLFSRACCDRTKGNSFKLKEGRFRLDIRKTFFTMRVVRHWHRLPRKVADAPSLETFKARLDGDLSDLIELKMPLYIAEGLDWMASKGPFQPKPFYDFARLPHCERHLPNVPPEATQDCSAVAILSSHQKATRSSNMICYGSAKALIKDSK